MNKFISLLAASFVSMFNVAYADEGMRLDSLMFRPAKQQLVSVTTISTNDVKYKLLNSNTQQFEITKINTDSVSNTFDYGVTKNFNIFAVIQYDKTQVKYPNTGTADAQGFQNPIFALKYRFLNQDAEGINFDATVPVSFDIVRSRRSDVTNDTKGTVADGRNTYGLKLELGKYIGNFGFDLSAEGTHYTDSKSIQQGGTYLRYSDSNSFSYAAEGQYRFTCGSISLRASKTQSNAFYDGSDNRYSYADSTAYETRLNLSDHPEKYAVELKLRKDYFGNTTFNNYLWIKNTVANTAAISFRYSF